jgi:hypothetical protein
VNIAKLPELLAGQPWTFHERPSLLHQERGWSALANLPTRARWFPQGDAAISATKRSREKPALQTEGFSMSAEIFDFKEAKERRHRDMIIKAKYASMLSNEILFADEAETVDREVQEGQPPNNKKD